MQGYRKTLFKSDVEKVCIGCGRTDGLYVHHKDIDKTNNALNNLEFRCPSCHRKVHPTSFNRLRYKRKKTVGDVYELRVVNDELDLPALTYIKI